MRAAGLAAGAMTALALCGCVAPAARPATGTRGAGQVPAVVVPRVEPLPPIPIPLAQAIAADPRLSLFRALAAAGDLPALVAGRGGVAVLAPVDAAFARLAPGTVEALLLPGNRPSLRHLLRFWVVPAGGWAQASGRRAAGAADAGVPTLDGEPLAMRDVPGEQRRPSPTRLVDAAGREAAIGHRPTSEGGLLVTLDRIVAPRSIAPGGDAGVDPSRR